MMTAVYIFAAIGVFATSWCLFGLISWVKSNTI